MLECWNANAGMPGMLECWNARMLECLECQMLRMPECHGMPECLAGWPGWNVAGQLACQSTWNAYPVYPIILCNSNLNLK